jgi:hypothetical protein
VIPSWSVMPIAELGPEQGEVDDVQQTEDSVDDPLSLRIPDRSATTSELREQLAI